MENNQTMEVQASVRNGVFRMVLSLIAIGLELAVFFLILTQLEQYATWLNVAIRVLALILVLIIYNRNICSNMKMPWIILILMFPVFGTCMYLIVGLNASTKQMRKRYEVVDAELLPLLRDEAAEAASKAAYERLKADKPRWATLSKYLIDKSGYPLYQNSDITYYDDAAKGLEAQKEELHKAEKFIFMEYHAIEDAESWHGLQDILAERVRAGVEVRVFYDDMGSIGFINTDFIERLAKVGINCRVFNPFMPGVNLFLNNRDHRKITVIDGKVGFTGGYNIANEYFNLTHPFGEWKDTGIKLTGEAVRSLTVTFLENWNAINDADENDEDYSVYLPETGYQGKEGALVQPYADSPLDDEHVGEEVYLSMANMAQRYCWYISPYLILTDEAVHAMSLAAKRGVDVRIITPGIPDKKLVYEVTRSYYHALAKNGVRIFEWTPGFCHCKMCVADDEIATCGTINLDYRSLYHHFENGCVYMDCQAVLDTRADFERTFAEANEVTELCLSRHNEFNHFTQGLLRLAAPLL